MEQSYIFTPENKPETSPESLVKLIKQLLDEEFTYEEFEGTHEIDSDTLRLSFTLEDDLLEIRSIEATETGLGGKVISRINAFADENKLTVIASNVKDTAIGFWIKMGYEEGTEHGEYIRN